MRVVIADDTLLVREGITRVLEAAGIEVSGRAATATELLEQVVTHNPDVAIIDIRMPPTYTDEGLEAARAIRSKHPATAVLVLSQYVEPGYALTLLGAGGESCGYLLKDRVAEVTHLTDALHRLTAGEAVIDSQLVELLLNRPRAAGPLDDLTDREKTILTLMAEGLTDRGIAERLWLSRKTVETHVRHILQKLTLPENPTHNRRVQAVLAFLQS